MIVGNFYYGSNWKLYNFLPLFEVRDNREINNKICLNCNYAEYCHPMVFDKENSYFKCCTIDFLKNGQLVLGLDLLGKNLYDCHSAESNEIIKRLVRDGASNVYTIGKKGKKKLIYQTPWYNPDGSVGGLVELSIVLPPEMPHFDRD